MCVIYPTTVSSLIQMTFEWEERPSQKTWKLTQDTKDKHIFLVHEACPYYQTGHKKVIANFDDSGKLIGVQGPNGTMFILQVCVKPLFHIVIFWLV